MNTDWNMLEEFSEEPALGFSPQQQEPSQEGELANQQGLSALYQ